jgi:phage terminase large subunit-like protein
MNPAKQYATDIVKHRIPAGGYIKLAAHRFLDDLERDDLYFDVEAYNRIVRFFNVVLWDGQMWNGKPMELAPFQHFIIANIYGLKYKSNGRRKTKHVYIQVGRKNTKTTTVAGLALYELTISGENDPQVLVGANNEQQAKICTNQAGKMVEDAELESEGIRLYKYQGKTHTITYNTGTIEAMSKEIKTKDGFMPSLGIVDEYHEATNARLLNVIESGQGNRLEPLSIVITTAGYNKSGPCYQTLRKTAIDILTGVLEDDSQFSLIYEPDPEDKPDDINTWMKANPMMGFIPSIEPYLESRWKKATNEGGETMQEFVTKNLNIWADSSAAPIQDREWVQNTKEAATLFRD